MLCAPTRIDAPERVGELDRIVVVSKSGLHQRIVLARTRILDQARIDLHYSPFPPETQHTPPHRTSACMHVIEAYVSRPIDIDVDVYNPTALQPPPTSSSSSLCMHARADESGCCAIDRWTSHLQRGHQGGLTRGADGRVLVADVQLGEGGVHLHAPPTRDATRCNDG